ncbi:MAG: cobyrinate a,c-diamide synthase [Pseudomonadota bacterium]
MKRSFLIAAPSSGAGKTTISLGLMRALSRQGSVTAAKSGPDYIDPQFHAVATGQPSVNLDAWAMSPERIRSLAQSQSGDRLIVEAAMGLFDGVSGTKKGSAAELAKILGLPVLLVIDAKGMAASISALVQGFTNHDPELTFLGLVLNNVGSPHHASILKDALSAAHAPPVLGTLARGAGLDLPSRHLGLVQALEHDDLDQRLDGLADRISESFDLTAFEGKALAASESRPHQIPPGQRIAVAQDEAFAFGYLHQLNDWREAGAEILPFSPLTNDAVPQADFVFLPGGYPELHAGRISQNETFQISLRNAAQTAEVYGECGGYMILGKGLIDKSGQRHEMAGLLKLETSFAKPKLHLGYRRVTNIASPFSGTWRAHEFHFASTLQAHGDPIFEVTDAQGSERAPEGLRKGRVSGSFLHLIDPE